MATVLICGFYGRQNAGDEAILAGMLAELGAADPGLRVQVASWDPDDTRRLHGVEAVPWPDIGALVQAVRRSDLVIVGGGGLFHDYWGVDRSSLLTARQAGIAQYASPIVLARLAGVPSLIYAAGVGPLRTPEGRALTRDVFGAADRVTVRDGGSKDLLAELGCDVSAVQIVPDPAFGLPPDDDPAVDSVLAGLPRPVLGVALRHWGFGVDQDAWLAEVGAGIRSALAADGGTALFVPLQSGTDPLEDDSAVCQAAAARIGDAGLALQAPPELDPLQRLSLLERCDRILSMRLHGVVAALRAGVPVVALGYDPKVDRLMASAGLTRACLPIPDWRREQVADALGAAARERTPVRLQTATNAPLAQAVATMLRQARQPTAAEALVRDLALGRVAEAIRSDELAARHEAERSTLVAALAQRALELSELRAEAGRLRLALEQEGRQLDDLRASLDRERASAQEQARQSEPRLREVTQRWEATRGELAALQATSGVRILARYWGWVRRALPAGSRRRRAAAWVRRRLGGGLSRSRAMPPLAGPAVPEEAATDRDALGRFLDRFSSREPRRAVMILAPTRLAEDEGQRSTHLALELGRRGIPVVFAYWRWRRDERCPQDRLAEGIYQIPVDELIETPAGVLSAFPAARRLLLIEFPVPGHFGLVAAARGRGWVTLYDVIDDWEAFHRVGQAPWYQADYEAHLLATADALTAVSPALAAKIRRVCGRTAELVPNGVRPEIARRDRAVPLERGEVTLGYFGNLTRAWFDWGLVAAVARARPTWLVHLVGFGETPPSNLPPNIHLKPKVPPGELAGLAANWDAGIVPFIASPLAEAADTTKLYEYLAMGLPVVVTGVVPPPGTDGLVAAAVGVDDFVRQVERVTRPDVHPVEQGRAFAHGARWAGRLDRMLDLLDRGEQRISLQAALFEAGG